MAAEAMTAAGDAARFPDQVAQFGTWRPKRLLWNTSKWFYDKPEEFKPETLLAVDVGGFSPLLGESYPELAARSRSMHRSRGSFPAAGRARWLEYLQHVDGDRTTSELVDGIDTTWGRVKVANRSGDLLERAYRDFRPEERRPIVPTLLEARALLAKLPAGRWTTASAPTSIGSSPPVSASTSRRRPRLPRRRRATRSRSTSRRRIARRWAWR